MPTPPVPASKPKSKWRRRFLILGVLMLVIGGCVAALPTIASLQTFKPRIESELTKTLGAPVTLRSYNVGWLSGVAIDGLVVGQPAGFAADQPSLSIERVRLQVGWLKALRQAFDVSGEIAGLQVLVIQKADGTTNLEALGPADAHRERRDGRDRDAGSDGERTADLLRRLRADFALRDASIDVVHEEKGKLESIRRLDATLDKRFGSTDFKLSLAAELAGTDAGKPPGKLDLAADVDASLERPIDVQFTSAGFDLARYKPLLDSFLGAGQLTELAGVLDGTIKARIENLDTVHVQGALTVDQPHLAGLLLQGMDVQAARWVVSPNMQIDLKGGGAAPRADLDGFGVDLGFLQVRGVKAADASTLFAGAQALALDFDVDLQALGKFGGPVPAQLGAQAGRLQGRAALQVPAGGFAVDDVMAFVSSSVHVDAHATVPSLGIGSASSLLGLDLGIKLQDGNVQVGLAPGASLNGGPLELSAALDLKQGTWPVSLQAGVRDSSLVADSLQALQYAVPLFAGLAQQAGVEIAGLGSMNLTLSGPGQKDEGESWLRWLNHWTGNGTLALAEGAVRPAAAFAALAQFADPESGGKLAFKDIGTQFNLRAGGVETALAKIDVKGKKIGVRGKTMLDGSMDHKLDLTDLLAGHKDGDKVLAFLKGTPIEAAITGTLTAPKLAMPDLQKLFTDALKNAAQDQLQKGAQDLLKKGLDDLFKKKKE